jgi:hypothetical protein
MGGGFRGGGLGHRGTRCPAFEGVTIAFAVYLQKKDPKRGVEGLNTDDSQGAGLVRICHMVRRSREEGAVPGKKHQ